MTIRVHRTTLTLATLAIVACSSPTEVTEAGGSEESSDTSTSTDNSTESGGDQGESETTEDPASASDTDSESAETTEGEGSLNPSACPEGEVALGYDGEELICASLEEASRAAMNDNCQIYFGHRDNCDDCADPPDKSGYSGGSCSLINGNNSGCIDVILGGYELPMIGIDLTGDVNDDDKFYFGFDCAPVDPLTTDAQMCPAGYFVVGIDDEGEPTCSNLASVVSEWGRESCGVYFGWRDSCPECSETPAKWVYADASDCSSGAGDNNVCVGINVDGRVVNLAGLNTDGDVNTDDSFYLSVGCVESEPSSNEGVAGDCPAGEFVTAIAMDGSVTCTAADALISDYVQGGCYSYFGTRDQCSDCTDPPERWAASASGECGESSQNALCAPHELGMAPTQFMSVVTPRGNVGGDDKFYVGYSCR